MKVFLRRVKTCICDNKQERANNDSTIKSYNKEIKNTYLRLSLRGALGVYQGCQLYFSISWDKRS